MQEVNCSRQLKHDGQRNICSQEVSVALISTEAGEGVIRGIFLHLALLCTIDVETVAVLRNLFSVRKDCARQSLCMETSLPPSICDSAIHTLKVIPNFFAGLLVIVSRSNHFHCKLLWRANISRQENITKCNLSMFNLFTVEVCLHASLDIIH